MTHVEIDYVEIDYIAFIAYAGPPPYPSMKYGRTMDSTQERSSFIGERLEYIDLCEEFCKEYFANGGQWVDFYVKFKDWYSIKENQSG